jgi:hypothetical protein
MVRPVCKVKIGGPVNQRQSHPDSRIDRAAGLVEHLGGHMMTMAAHATNTKNAIAVHSHLLDKHWTRREGLELSH